MGQLYKEYDKKYAEFSGMGLKNLGHQIDESYLVVWTHWNQEEWGPYLTYSQEKIQWAVYQAEGFEDWQKFRVSLKGLETREKLLCLGNYYVTHMKNNAQEELTKIRINNYLGALIRGGQLNDKLEIQR